MEFLIRLPGLLSAIIFHEMAHGFVAYKLGDNTAKDRGRLSFNPMKHIDLTGFLFMLVFKFGWAKPVPIDSSNFENRKKGIFLTSIAGPAANFVLAIGLVVVMIFNIINPFFYSGLINEMIQIAIWYNIMLGTFNLLPFPPLDGSKILASLLPDKWEYYFYKYERYFYIVLVGLILTNGIDKILSPILLAEIKFLNDIIYKILIKFI